MIEVALFIFGIIVFAFVAAWVVTIAVIAWGLLIGSLCMLCDAIAKAFSRNRIARLEGK